jgi:hypothetical protein
LLLVLYGLAAFLASFLWHLIVPPQTQLLPVFVMKGIFNRALLMFVHYFPAICASALLVWFGTYSREEQEGSLFAELS